MSLVDHKRSKVGLRVPHSLKLSVVGILKGGKLPVRPLSELGSVRRAKGVVKPHSTLPWDPLEHLGDEDDSPVVPERLGAAVARCRAVGVAGVRLRLLIVGEVDDREGEELAGGSTGVERERRARGSGAAGCWRADVRLDQAALGRRGRRTHRLVVFERL